MKKIILFFLIVSCNKSEYQNLDLLLQTNNRCSQPTFMNKFVIGNSFCNTSYFINADSTYNMESGCEGNSKIEIGKWKINGDSITLFPTIKEVNILAKLEQSENNINKGETVFIIKDKEYKPIENFEIITFNKTSLIESGKYNYYETDSYGKCILDYKKYDSIYFPKLISSINKIRSTKLPDTIKMVLDVNRGTIQYPQFEYNNLAKKRTYRMTDSTLGGMRKIRKVLKTKTKPNNG